MSTCFLVFELFEVFVMALKDSFQDFLDVSV